MSRSSTDLAISLTLSLHHSHADRHLVRQSRQAHLRRRLSHATQLVQDRTRTNHGSPKLGLALALTHAGFERDRRDRFVREDADVQTPFAADVLRRRNTSGLDRLGTHPATFNCLQTVLTKDDALAARGVTFYTSSLAFSVLDPLGHQRHRVRPRTCLG